MWLDSSRNYIVSNLTVAIVFFIIFYLAAVPYQRRTYAENTFPPDVYRVIPSSNVANFSIQEEDTLRIQELVQTDKIAVIGNISFYMGQSPKMLMTSSTVHMGLVSVIEGDIGESTPYTLAQIGSPYSIGELVNNQPVVGMVSTILTGKTFDDTILFQVVSDYQKVGAKKVWYIQSSDISERDSIQKSIEKYLQTEVQIKPITEFITPEVYGFELRQFKMQRLAAVFLLVSLMFLIYSNLAKKWLLLHEVLRTERMLGRSYQYFIYTWLKVGMKQWFWGVAISTFCCIGFTVLQGLDSRLIVQTIVSLLVITVAGIILSLSYVLIVGKIPLARKSTDSEMSFWDYLPMLVVGTSLTFGSVSLLASTFASWQEVSKSVGLIGENSIVASTTRAATSHVGEVFCQRLELNPNDNCASFGVTNIALWPEELWDLSEIPNMATSFQMSADASEVLNIQLIEGRFPQRGMREVAVSSHALPIVRARDPSFGIGSVLDLSYKVVGIVEMPYVENNIFRSVYASPLLLPYEAPQFQDEYFLSPLGESGVVLHFRQNEEIPVIKQKIRGLNQHMRVIQPAVYLQDIKNIVILSLWRLSVLMVVIFVFALFVQANVLTVMLLRRTYEISIWRLLGMNVHKLRQYLSRAIYPLTLGASTVGTLLGCLALNLQHAESSTLIGLAFGGIVIILFSCLSYIIMHFKLRPFAKKELDVLYRKAL